ncbi:MAG: hypothetical protein IKX45_08015 [Bacteroidales bacterium]|nr:hypothetical protein [Bacteroidales bacterium]
MMKILLHYTLYFLLAAAVLSTACKKEVDEDYLNQKESLQKTFKADIPATKVLVDGSRRALWQAGDDISVEGARFSIDSYDGASAVFSGTVSETKDHYLAALPWSDDYSFGDKTVSGTLPYRQIANEGGCSWPLAYAWSEGSSLHFHHLSCVLQLTLGADMTDVKEIVLHGNAGEVLAGDFSLSLSSEGAVSSFSSGAFTATSVSLYGTLEANKTYCFNVLGLGTVFSSGLTLEFLFEDGTSARITKSTSISLPKSNWINLSDGITKAQLSPVSRGIASLSDWRSFKSALEASGDISSYLWNGEVLLKSNLSLTESDALTALSVPLNGGGHTITYNGTSALIGTLSAKVHDLNLEGTVSFGANSDVGALAALAETGISITNVNSDVDITAGALGNTTSLRIGGLVGRVLGDSGKLKFDGCSVTGTLTSLNYAQSVGGIIAHGGGGSAPEVVIDNCEFNGAISYTQGACPYDFDSDAERSAGRVGGLIGDASRVVTIKNSSTGNACIIDAYLYGMTIGRGGIGGLIGRTTGDSAGYTMQVALEGTNTNNAAITIHDALTGQHSRCNQIIGSQPKAPSGSGVSSGSLAFSETPSPSTATTGHFSLCQLAGQTTGSEHNSLDGTRSSNEKNYMSYIIITSGGKIIVIDGGWNGGDMWALITQIVAHGGYVDAWFISHPHEDHFRALSEILANPSYGVTIGTIYHSRASSARYSPESAIDVFYNRLDSFGGIVVDIRTPGGRYDVDGVGIKVLSVCDEGLSTDLNNSSMVLRIWDDIKSAVFLGDAGVLEGRKLLATCPEDLNCDFLQIAHHGNKGCEEAFYNTVSFNYALVPTAEWIWRADLYYSPMPENLDGGLTRSWIEGKLPYCPVLASYNGDVWVELSGAIVPAPEERGGMIDGFDNNGSDYFN